MFLARTIGLMAALLALSISLSTPASAGSQVYSTKMVCAEVNFAEPVLLSAATLPPIDSIVQTAGNGTSQLGTTNTDVQVRISMASLPASSPVLCLVACIVDGSLDLFNLNLFVPCNADTNNAGRFTFNGTIPLADIYGGCLLPVVALAVLPETASPVVCAPGFGTFEPFEPDICLSAC